MSRIWWAGFDHLEIREKFFMVRVERSQNWLLREAVGAPALEVLKADLIGLWVIQASERCPAQGRRVGPGGLMVPPTQTTLRPLQRAPALGLLVLLLILASSAVIIGTPRLTFT